MRYLKQNNNFSLVLIAVFILVHQNVFSGCNSPKNNDETEGVIDIDSSKNGYTVENFKEILNGFMDKNYENVYHSFGNGELRARCTPDFFVRYFSFTNKIYGNMSNPRLVTFDTFTEPNTGITKWLTGFDVDFENVGGHFNLALIQEEDSTFTISDFRILVTDGEEFPFIQELTSGTLTDLNDRNFDKLYNNATKRFREYTPNDQWMKLKEFMNDIDFSDATYMSSVVLLDFESIIASTRFHLKNSKKYLALSFVVNDYDTYTLNGINIFD